MPTPLPFLRNTASSSIAAQVLTPFTLSINFVTNVQIFQTGGEQRWPELTSGPLYSFSCPMNKLLVADWTSWQTFFNSAKGRLGSNFQIVFAGNTYNNLILSSDEIATTTKSAKMFDQQINLSQTPPATGSWSAWVPPSIGSNYPTMACGAVAEYPTTEALDFLTDVNDSDFSVRYAYGYYDTGLTNFPTTGLRLWRLSYPLLSNADLSTITTFFSGCQGRYNSFSFTSPFSGSTYSNVRFDSDQLAVRYITPTQSSIEVVLRQHN